MCLTRNSVTQTTECNIYCLVYGKICGYLRGADPKNFAPRDTFFHMKEV